MRPSARAGRLLAALLCVLALTACSSPPPEGTCDNLPGGIDPVLMVEGTRSLWHGVNNGGMVIHADEKGRLTSYMPEGCESLGPLGEITEDPPEKDLQMQAGFEAAGEVYGDPDKPLVVYVLMTTDWFKETYIRFESEELGDHLIRWDGRLFRFPQGAGQPLEALPEGCVSIGTLTFVPPDTLPENDLECNGMTDNFGHTLTGREVFQDPADPEVLYVFETQYWQGGSFPAWEPCRIWEPGDPLYPAEE